MGQILDSRIAVRWQCSLLQGRYLANMARNRWMTVVADVLSNISTYRELERASFANK